ncbi:hypothetical protein PVAND_007563 [Polypedilum vanderplanki]|uniref:Uncharacterized protein n=1 Tax=Polypedilum vanderplanki TaxID=319348 RepID=A0A9J6C6Y1_POLVA|nr:hypothetical protein PVAND_007563 [Polypedilum vanderplanki]
MEEILDYDQQDYFERLYLNVKFSTFSMGLILMMIIFILHHVIASYFSINFFLANSIALLTSMKAGIIFMDIYCSRELRNFARSVDFTQDFYGILIAITSVSLILQTTILPDIALGFVIITYMLTSTLLLVSFIFSGFLIAIYIFTSFPPP